MRPALTLVVWLVLTVAGQGRAADAGSSLNVQDALADAQELFLGIEGLHPDPLGRIDGEAWLAAKAQAVATLTAAGGKRGTVSRELLARTLMRAVAQLSDGQTSLWPDDRPDEAHRGARELPPFRLAVVAGQCVVTRAVDPSLVHAVLLEVDGAPCEEFLSGPLALCSGERVAQRLRRFAAAQDLLWPLSGALKGRASLRVRARLPDGAVVERAVTTVDAVTFPAPGPVAPLAEAVQLELPGDGQVGVLTVRAFESSERFLGAMYRAFDTLAERRVRRLVIDVRGVETGEPWQVERLFSQLSARPFRVASKVTTRVSAQALQALRLRGELAGLKGLNVTEHPPQQHEPPHGQVFEGAVVVVTDEGTSNVGTDFAALVRDEGRGVLVGAETGGVVAASRRPQRFVLSNSRLRYQVPLVLTEASRPHPGDGEHGVVPEVVAPLPSNGDEDPALRVAMERVKALP